MITLLTRLKNAGGVNTAQLTSDAQTLLELLGYPDFDLGILLTTNTTIARYNRDYRGKDKPTDVLSFSYHPTNRPGTKIRAKTPEDKNLGDLIMSPAYIKTDLGRWGKSFDERMQELLVHGICHLLGYDHETDSEFRVMRRKELSLLRKLHKEIKS